MRSPPSNSTARCSGVAPTWQHTHAINQLSSPNVDTVTPAHARTRRRTRSLVNTDVPAINMSFTSSMSLRSTA